MSDKRFDDIFDAVSSEAKKSEQPNTVPSQTKVGKKKAINNKSEQGENSQVDDFWSSMNKPDMIRLNVDISIALNKRLSAKAKKLKQTKSELVRRLIEWSLTD
jgi:macrodomain Ter protein organizer (MatP/YcbG family)